MKNYQDKVWAEGSLETILKINGFLGQLPDGTFPRVEIEPGEKKMLYAELIKEAGGQAKKLKILYPLEENNQNRRVNTPSGTDYIETTDKITMNFEYQGLAYEVIMKK